MITLKGRTAFITGSSRGVGQQLAIGLAELDCNIIVHGRTETNCLETIKLLKKFNVKVYSVHGELTREESVKEIIKQVRELDTKVDVLYNNAALGTTYHENYWNHSWDDWIKTFKVNVFAMYDLCGAFIPEMIQNGFGRVVNLTSGIKDTPELAPYGTSKGAVDKMTADLAIKLENTSVRINTLDPGWLKTDMGGENAEHPVDAVLPGGLAPVLIEDDGPNGKFFSAIDHKLDDETIKTLGY